MVYFTEKLINEIRKRSCIWDTTDVNHLNKEVLTNNWAEIADNLYSDWETLNVFGKRERVADIKKKWTNIKDSFVKDLKGNKPRKSLCLPEHRRKYYLFDHLQFLIPHIQDTKTGGGGRSDEDAAGKPASKKMCKDTLHGEGSSRNALSMAEAPPSETAPKRPETPLLSDLQQHADLLNQFSGKTAAHALCQLDGDLSFMVSVLPTIKSMNERQKLDFKIGILQLVSRIKFDRLQNNPPGMPIFPMASHYQNRSPPGRQLQQAAGARRPLPYSPVTSTQQVQHHTGRQPAVEHVAPRVKQEGLTPSSPGSSSWVFDTDSSTEEDMDYMPR